MSDVPVAGSYDEGMGVVDIEGLVHQSDDRTPLDKTIDRIGMGSYQWTLWCLCGFGWMADDMWMDALGLILPRVQQHFSVHDGKIGILSAAMSAGMMFGAAGWGACSDQMGRTIAFNATLFLTSVFGLFASVAGTFAWLCFALFLLGSAVGGSMPTDGTLLLEHMPSGKKYLITALFIFFSFGTVLTVAIGLLVIPKNSCPPSPAACDVATQNMGWKYLLIALGLITLAMFLARIVFFRLHESPRYLVHAGRPQEAVEVLKMISKFNGFELSLDLADVDDNARSPAAPVDSSNQLVEEDAERRTLHSSLRDVQHYGSMGAPDVALREHESDILLPRNSQNSELLTHSLSVEPDPVPIPKPRPILRRQVPSSMSRDSMSEDGSSTVSEHVKSSGGLICRVLPQWMSRSALAWIDRIATVLTPEWLQTTLRVWAAWFSISLAYRSISVYLPKLLEERSSSNDSPGRAPDSVEHALWGVMIYALGGCPGAILGAWLVESPLGHRRSLAGSICSTAFFYWTFILFESSWAVRASLVGINLSATVTWAVLYGWTPEIFETKVRGTACGIAFALARIAAMIGPILGGWLLTVDNSLLVYTSITLYLFAGACVLLLEERKVERGGVRVLAH